MERLVGSAILFLLMMPQVGAMDAPVVDDPGGIVSPPPVAGENTCHEAIEWFKQTYQPGQPLPFYEYLIGVVYSVCTVDAVAACAGVVLASSEDLMGVWDSSGSSSSSSRTLIKLPGPPTPQLIAGELRNVPSIRHGWHGPSTDFYGGLTPVATQTIANSQVEFGIVYLQVGLTIKPCPKW